MHYPQAWHETWFANLAKVLRVPVLCSIAVLDLKIVKLEIKPKEALIHLAGSIVLPDQVRHAIPVEISRTHHCPAGNSTSANAASAAIAARRVINSNLPHFSAWSVV